MTENLLRPDTSSTVNARNSSLKNLDSTTDSGRPSRLANGGANIQYLHSSSSISSKSAAVEKQLHTIGSAKGQHQVNKGGGGNKLNSSQSVASSSLSMVLSSSNNKISNNTQSASQHQNLASLKYERSKNKTRIGANNLNNSHNSQQGGNNNHFAVAHNAEVTTQRYDAFNGTLTLPETGNVFARVATDVGEDGLAHFEKDDYEKFVEDRHRAILFGTLPNRLEDANPTFKFFINKLRHIEQYQKQHSQPSYNSSIHAAALAAQHRLEAIDDEEDFVDSTYLQSQHTQPKGRQVGGGHNQQLLYKRVSRPPTRGGTAVGYTRTGSSFNGHIKHNNNLLTAAQVKHANSSFTKPPPKMKALVTGHSVGQAQSIRSNGTNHTPSIVQIQNKKVQQPSYSYYGTASEVSNSGVFPFPSPSNVLYNFTRPVQSSKLSLPSLMRPPTGQLANRQLKIVKTKFHPKVDSTISAASSNH